MLSLEAHWGCLILFVYNVLGAVVFRWLTGRVVNYLLLVGAPFQAVVGILVGMPPWMVVNGYFFATCLHVLSFAVHGVISLMRIFRKRK